MFSYTKQTIAFLLEDRWTIFLHSVFMKKDTEYYLKLEDSHFDQAKFKDTDPGKLIGLILLF